MKHAYPNIYVLFARALQKYKSFSITRLVKLTKISEPSFYNWMGLKHKPRQVLMRRAIRAMRMEAEELLMDLNRLEHRMDRKNRSR